MALSIPETIRVLLPGGAVRKMPLETYVRGVVTAALPADAPLEALKAQAVAARTFGAITRRHIERGSDVCTLRHCQLWKESASAAARRATDDTRGIVAVHDGRLIDAYYFEHCDGNTRDGKGILIQAPPYLRSVTCPCGFATLKGHGVGMCQRGVQVMARFGDTFDVILKHYFKGITLERASGMPIIVPEPKAAPLARVKPSPNPLVETQASEPEAPSQAAKTRQVAGTSKTPSAKKSAAAAPDAVKPIASASSPGPTKARAPVEKAKVPQIVPTPPPTQPAAPIETPKAAKVVATPPPTRPAAGVETPKPTKVVPTPAPAQSTARVETPKATKSVLTPASLQSTARAETPKATKVVPTPAPTQPTARVETPKATTSVATPAPAQPTARAQPPTTARITPAPSQARALAALAPKPIAPAPQPPPSAPESIIASKPPPLATSRETSAELMAEEEASWYPIAEEIVPGAAKFEAEMIDEALEATKPLEESSATIARPEVRSCPFQAEAHTPPFAVAPPTWPEAATPASVKEFLPLPPPPETMPEDVPVFRIEEVAVAPLPKMPPPPLLEEEFLPLAPPPGTMPEEMPVLWIEEVAVAPLPQMTPPPLLEEELLISPMEARPSPVLIDRLPGPRMIVGNLAAAGTIITIRDIDGHAVITVSGAAPHYGPGGFEAPLADCGKYTVSFDHNALEVDLGDETVFIQISG